MLEWLEKHMLPCPVREVTGLPCPGCGMQRSILDILHGDIVNSLIHYPALIPLSLMLIFLLLHLKFDYKYGAKILMISFIINAIIISLSYIIKMIYLN